VKQIPRVIEIRNGEVSSDKIAAPVIFSPQKELLPLELSV